MLSPHVARIGATQATNSSCRRWLPHSYLSSSSPPEGPLVRRASAKEGGDEDLAASVSLVEPCSHGGGHGWWADACFSMRRPAVLAIILSRGGGKGVAGGAGPFGGAYF